MTEEEKEELEQIIQNYYKVKLKMKDEISRIEADPNYSWSKEEVIFELWGILEKSTERKEFDAQSKKTSIDAEFSKNFSELFRKIFINRTS